MSNSKPFSCEWVEHKHGFRCQLCNRFSETKKFTVCSRKRPTDKKPRKRYKSSQLRSENEQLRVLSVCKKCEYFTSEEYCTELKCESCENSKRELHQHYVRRGDCPLGKWAITNPERLWVSYEDRYEATLALAEKIPGDITGVIGVSRSGLTPALLLAETLHLQIYSYNPLTEEVTELGSGWRLRGTRPGRFLLVDDTVASGHSLSKINLPSFKEAEVVKSAVFVNPDRVKDVSYYGQLLSLPHYLEWNFFNSIHSRDLAVDFDGILCEECPPEVDANEEHYRVWLTQVKPLYLPRKYPIKLIATGRLSKYRQITVNWLHHYGIRFRDLVMCEATSREERNSNGDKFVTQRKASAFVNSQASIFVESCPVQAKRIKELSSKTVICPAKKVVL